MIVVQTPALICAPHNLRDRTLTFQVFSFANGSLGSQILSIAKPIASNAPANPQIIPPAVPTIAASMLKSEEPIAVLNNMPRKPKLRLTSTKTRNAKAAVSMTTPIELRKK